MSYVLIILAAGAGVYSLFFRKKHVELVEAACISYFELLDVHVPFYHNLDINEKNRFEKRVREFFRKVRIEGVGTEVTDVDRVLIAADAVIPIFGFPEWRYRNLTNVILYPDTIDGEFQFEGECRNILGMHPQGPVQNTAQAGIQARVLLLQLSRLFKKVFRRHKELRFIRHHIGVDIRFALSNSVHLDVHQVQPLQVGEAVIKRRTDSPFL